MSCTAHYTILEGVLLHETLYVPSIPYSAVVVKLYLIKFNLRYLPLSFYILDWLCHFNNCIIVNFLSFILPP